MENNKPKNNEQEGSLSKLARHIECESARLKARTPEQRQADREQELLPGIFISREEMAEFRGMSPGERKDKLKELNQRLAESVLVE